MKTHEYETEDQKSKVKDRRLVDLAAPRPGRPRQSCPAAREPVDRQCPLFSPPVLPSDNVVVAKVNFSISMPVAVTLWQF